MIRGVVEVAGAGKAGGGDAGASRDSSGRLVVRRVSSPSCHRHDPSRLPSATTPKDSSVRHVACQA